MFDFRPMVTTGAELLGRRGEDARLETDRPAAVRRREIDAAMPSRGENETRADVARRLGVLDPDDTVVRRNDPADGRATIARITAAGEDAFRATAPVYLAKIDEHFNAHLSPRERTVIATALQRVADAERPARPRRSRPMHYRSANR